MLDPSADPTAEQFRSLARSSPWRWSTLEYERSTFNGQHRERGYVRRPDQLRVESPDGALRRLEPSPEQFVNPPSHTPRMWPTDVAPVYDDDGLVLARPEEKIPFSIEYDLPFNSSYHWVATLDPSELADGHDIGSAEPPVELRAVLHHGRPAWEVLAMPTTRYAPRCMCCSLLDGFYDNDAGQWAPWGASLVRLDVQTGICVFVQHEAGTFPLRYPSGETLMFEEEVRIDLDLRIIAVDEPMDDDLFVRPS